MNGCTKSEITEFGTKFFTAPSDLFYIEIRNTRTQTDSAESHNLHCFLFLERTAYERNIWSESSLL